jgi:hypothetical protein
LRSLRQLWEMLLKLCNILYAVNLRGSLNSLKEITLSSASNSSKVQYSDQERIFLLTCTLIADCGGKEMDQAKVCLRFANYLCEATLLKALGWHIPDIALSAASWRLCPIRVISL